MRVEEVKSWWRRCGKPWGVGNALRQIIDAREQRLSHAVRIVMVAAVEGAWHFGD